jgi:hypothetical protein
MNFAELKANLGKEVLAILGTGTDTYSKRKGVLMNVVEFAIHYPDKVERNLKATVQMNDENTETLELPIERIFSLKEDATLTAKTERLNAAVSTIRMEAVDAVEIKEGVIDEIRD